MAKLRIVLLGCGKIAVTHAKRLQKHRDVELCFASRDRNKAEEYARRFGGVDAFGSYQDAIADPRVEAVVVTTPPNSHLDLALAALEAGKHAVVEKPAFMRAADFDRVALAKDASHRQMLVAENYFYRPLSIAMREVIATKEIGDLRILHVDALKAQPVVGWRDDPALGGDGALFEGGIHWINFMANLGLAVTGVQAFRPVRGAGPERTMMVVFQYASGAVGTLYYSWETNVALHGLHLSSAYGSEGAVTFESNGIFMVVRGRRRRLVGPKADLSGVTGMWNDFVPALRKNREALYSFDASRRDMQLLEAAYRSLSRDLSIDIPN